MASRSARFIHLATSAIAFIATDASVHAQDSKSGPVAEESADGQIGKVKVTATDQTGAPGAVPHGANGSSDPTATEGTRSYAPTKVNVGGKVPVSVKDVPQTVSVITRQLIEDQHLNTLTDVMEFTPGVTVLERFGADQFFPSFFSRGFQVQNFQIDGGAPISYGADANYTSSLTPVFDMSKYDHVEILRGAGGAFTGTGDPGGVLSLERKRPTGSPQILGELGGGSFNAFRASADFSEPVVKDGSLKVRAILTHDQRDYFYRVANKTLDMAYVNAEFAPSSTTRINFGGSYTDQRGVPFGQGLPRYTDGGDIGLPRETCLCLAFGKYHTKELELFAQFEHHFSDDWALNVNLTSNRQRSLLLAGAVQLFSGISRATGMAQYGASVYASRQSTRSIQDLADVFVTGRFSMFGRDQHIVVGMNYQKQNDKPVPGSGEGQYAFPDTNVNVFTFDPRAYTLPADSAFQPLGYTVRAQNRLQLAAYGSLRLEPLAHLHLDIALRYNSYKTNQQSHYDNGFGFTSDTNKIFTEGKLLPAVLAASYDVTKNMSVYASYAGIYQSLALQLTASGHSLPSVTGTNIELGVKRTDFQGKMTSTLSVYRIVQNNLPITDPSVPYLPGNDAIGSTCCYISTDRNRSEGFDLEITGAVLPRLQVTFSYTHNTNKYDPGAAALAFGNSQNPLVSEAPKDLVKLFTAYRLGSSGVAGRITLGGGGRLQSKVTTNTFACITTCGPLTLVQPGYALLDLFSRVVLTRNLTVQVNVNNLFDKHYFSTIGSIFGNNYYGEPRSFAAVLRSKF